MHLVRRLVLAPVLVVCLLTNAFSDGTEVLGPPSIPIASGSGVVAKGVGLAQAQPGVINIDVPGTVVQVLLYWEGQHFTPDGDNTVVINGNNVTGTLIGGPTHFFNLNGDPNAPVRSSTYRADITSLGIVTPGPNALTVGGLDFGMANHGAGVLVIYNDGTSSHIELRDGSDLAYLGFAEPLYSTVEQVFTFAPASTPRIATVNMFFSSVDGAISGSGIPRPNRINVTVGGATHHFQNVLGSGDGEEWDTFTRQFLIPPGVTEIRMQAESGPGGDITGTQGPKPASLTWTAAGISIASPEACGPCKGKATSLTLRYDGATDANIEVRQKKPNTVVFSGVVLPGGQFSFVGLDNKGTLSTEISIYVNGTLNTKIHTSCSKPIGPGLVSGLFTVVSGYSLKGGLLCPITPSTPPILCDGKAKPVVLTMLYTGDNCSATSHSQDPSKVTCETYAPLTQTVYIVATDKGNKQTWFAGTVHLDSTFDISAGTKPDLGAELFVRIFDAQGGNLLQLLRFHTSCSQPLEIGNHFGSLMIAAYVAKEPKGPKKIGDESEVESYVLHQNYPNPFNPETEIVFEMLETGELSLKVYNTLGQEIRSLASGHFEAGVYSVRWDGRDNNDQKVVSGVYIYQLRAANVTQVRKMTLLK
jgi:hypothetical protein